MSMQSFEDRNDSPSGLAANLPEPLRGPWTTMALVALVVAVSLGSGLLLLPFLDLTAAPMSARNMRPMLAGITGSQLVFAAGAVLLALGSVGVARRLALDRIPPRGISDYVAAFGGCIGLTTIYNSIREFALGHDVLADLLLLAPFFRNPLWPASFVVIAIVAPVAEELLFRGILFPALARTRLGFWGAAIVSTIGWTLLHSYSLAGMILVFLLGMLFSWVFARTGSLRVPIVAHVANNTIAALMLQFVV